MVDSNLLDKSFLWIYYMYLLHTTSHTEEFSFIQDKIYYANLVISEA